MGHEPLGEKAAWLAAGTTVALPVELLCTLTQALAPAIGELALGDGPIRGDALAIDLAGIERPRNSRLLRGWTSL